jgi:hypothetical protein
MMAVHRDRVPSVARAEIVVEAAAAAVFILIFLRPAWIEGGERRDGCVVRGMGGSALRVVGSKRRRLSLREGGTRLEA